MIKTTEKFNFSEPILNTTKLGLNRLSVYNSVFNVNRGKNQFLCAGTVLDDDDALAEPVIFISNTNFSPTSNNIFFLNFNYKGIPLLYSTIAYELTEIAELIKKETEGDVILEPDKNRKKYLMETKQGALNLDVN